MATNGPVGERIAIYRRRRGLSQAVLAGLIGRSVSWLSQVERGIRAVDRMSVLIDLSRVLKVDISELTGQPFALAPNGGLEPEGPGAQPGFHRDRTARRGPEHQREYCRSTGARATGRPRRTARMVGLGGAAAHRRHSRRAGQ